MRSDKKRSKKSSKATLTVLIVLIIIAVTLALAIALRDGRLFGGGQKGETVCMTAKTAAGALSPSLSEGRKILTAIHNGEISTRDIGYDILFEDTVILGDSVTDGLLVYGFLDDDKVFCQVGGSVLNSQDAIPQAAAAQPEIAFFSFGSNEMGMFSGDEELFTQRYEEFIRDFTALSPETKIYVNSIPKPSDERIASGGYFYKWQDFNTAIQAMCGRLGAGYIDNTQILIERPELYAGDGIHVSPNYYIYWLTNMMNGASLLDR